MAQRSERRLVENELVFRQANTDIEQFMEDMGAKHATTLPFFCECSYINCRGRIEMSADEYQKIHANRRYFMLLDGHDIPKVERIVERHENYNVVEKLGELPGENDLDKAIKRLAF